MALRRVLRHQIVHALAALLALAGARVLAQEKTFQFVISAVDKNGNPVGDLRAEDIVMSENGERQTITKVEPLSVPMKLTVAIDNSATVVEAIDHYRAGLSALVDALPGDVEVSLIALAPQPRNLLKPTTDQTQLLKAIKSFGPENGSPRFSDALVEYSQRLQKESKDAKAPPYLPVLVMVSTASTDRTNYQPKDIEKAVAFLAERRARVSLIMVSTRPGDVKTATALGQTMQGIVGKTAVQLTKGYYEELGVASRLATLLPEWGKGLAGLHERQKTQFRVTVERKNSGNLQNPQIQIARPGIDGTVTRDGFLP